MAFILNTVMGAELSVAQIFAAGVTPFIVGGLIKAAIAAAVIPLAWRGVAALDRDRDRDQGSISVNGHLYTRWPFV